MYYYKQSILEVDTLTMEDWIELQMVIATINSAEIVGHKDPYPITWTSEE